MGDKVRAWTGAELAEHEKWAKRAPHSDDARWLETVRQLNAKLDRLRLQKEELIDSDARQVEEIARLRAAPGSRLVEAARDTARSLARWAQAVRDSAPTFTVRLDPSWAENRAKELESALAALPEADAGKCQTCDGHGFYMVNAHGPNEVKCDDCDGSGDRKADPAPIPMILHCPECRTRHVDEGEFATKVHNTHSCQSCGLSWRPAVVPTVGVRFLPGFKNDAAMFESIGNEVQDRPAPDTMTAPELTRIASTLTEADDLPDIGRANTMLSGPDAEKDVRAVLAEAKAALVSIGDCPDVHTCETCLPRARAAAKAIGEVLSRPAILPDDGEMTACSRCGVNDLSKDCSACGGMGASVLSPERDRLYAQAADDLVEIGRLREQLESVRKAAHDESWRLGSQIEERDHQIAREREAVDGLLAVLAGEDTETACLSSDEWWPKIYERIEAVRKSRDRVGSSPDGRLGWSTEIRVRATPSLEFRGLELPDSGEQPVVPRVVAVPDAEGWWAVFDGSNVYAYRIAKLSGVLAVVVRDDATAVDAWASPDEQWFGPLALPEGWL